MGRSVRPASYMASSASASCALCPSPSSRSLGGVRNSDLLRTWGRAQRAHMCEVHLAAVCRLSSRRAQVTGGGR